MPDVSIDDGEDVFYPAHSTILSKELKLFNPSIEQQSPYFEPPKVNETVRFTSPLTSPKPKHSQQSPQESILEELLPSHIPINQTRESSVISIGDRIFGLAFKTCFGLWLVMSLGLFLYSPRAAALSGLWQASYWFLLVLAASLAGAFVWAHLLATQTEAVVYGMSAAIPIGSAALALYLLGSGALGSVMAAGLICLSAISAAVLWTKREELQMSVSIVRTGAQFVQENPQILKLTAQISISYAVFVVLWIGSFCRLTAMTSSILLKALFVTVLLWTGALIGSAQKFMIGSAVNKWIAEEEVEKVDWDAFDENFDSLCVAASILAVTRLVRLTAKALHLTASRIGAGRISSILNQFSAAVEASLARFTDYVIFMLALTPESNFWSACSSVTRILTDRPSLSLTVDTISQLLLHFATLLLAFASTAMIYALTAHRISFLSAGLLGLVCLLELDLVGAVFTASIDAAFLNYLHLPRSREKRELQAAFSSKLVSV